MIARTRRLQFAAATFVALPVGCDQSASTTDVTPTASIAAPAWNGGDAKGRLLGLWVASEGVSNERDEKARRMERALTERTFKFDFRDDRRVFLHFGRDVDAEEGTWDIVRNEAGALVVRITAASSGVMDFSLDFSGEDRFTMRQVGVSADALAFTLTRLRGAS
jgi:hypothetical protein